MKDYIHLIATYYPGTQCSTSGTRDNYSAIQWVSVPISQVDLDAAYLAEVKTDKILELSVAAESEIINGFASTALGTEYWYDSEPEDQLNLVGSVASGDDMYYACRVGQGGTKQYLLHTHLQLQAVLQSGRDIKLAVLQKFTTKRDAVLACSTEAQVSAITWVN